MKRKRARTEARERVGSTTHCHLDKTNMDKTSMHLVRTIVARVLVPCKRRGGLISTPLCNNILKRICNVCQEGNVPTNLFAGRNTYRYSQWRIQ